MFLWHDDLSSEIERKRINIRTFFLEIIIRLIFCLIRKNPSNFYSQVIEVISKCQQMIGSVNVYWYSTCKCLYAYIMNLMIIWFLLYYSRSYRGSYGNNYSSKILQPIGSEWFLGVPSCSRRLSMREKNEMRRSRRHWWNRPFFYSVYSWRHEILRPSSEILPCWLQLIEMLSSYFRRWRRRRRCWWQQRRQLRISSRPGQ